MILPPRDLGEYPIQLPPTGTCFDDGLDFYEAMALAGYTSSLETLSRILLCHGICERDGRLFGHAWNQTPAYMIQAGRTPLGRQWYAIRAADFRRFFRPSYVRVYTLTEALVANDAHNHFGPWDPEIEKHCLNGRSDRLNGLL